MLSTHVPAEASQRPPGRAPRRPALNCGSGDLRAGRPKHSKATAAAQERRRCMLHYCTLLRVCGSASQHRKQNMRKAVVIH